MLMAAASQFAFRTGNLAVGTKFDLANNWSAGIVAQLALLATESLDTTYGAEPTAIKPSRPTLPTSIARTRNHERFLRGAVAIAGGATGVEAALSGFPSWCPGSVMAPA